MFFRNMTPAEKESSSEAVKISYLFFLVALLGHALYSLLLFSEFNASFWILSSGCVVNTISEFLFRKRAERASHE